MNGEELEELSIGRDLRVSSVLVNTVEEVGLFIIVRSEDNIVNDSLQDLQNVSSVRNSDGRYLQSEASGDPPQRLPYPELVCSACRHPGTCRRAWQE